MEYAYTSDQIGKILQKLIAKVRRELDIAAENGTINELMQDYGITLEEGAMPVSPKISKILVVCHSS